MILVETREYVYLLSFYRAYTYTLPRNAIRMCTLPWTNLGWAPVEFLHNPIDPRVSDQIF
jgi:hypothetical protein